MIGGNINLALQVKRTTENAIGESELSWETVQTLLGWLDYQSGDSPRTSFNKKVEQSTHFFIGDYVPINKEVTEENSRAVVDGKVYDVLIIDDPMGMHRQIEIYLKYTGGQI